MSAYRCTTDRVAVDGAPALVACVEDSGRGLRAAIVPQRGAELASLQVRRRGGCVELLHRALDFSPTDEWQGRAPLLWPAAGRNFTPPQLEEVLRAGDDPPLGSWEHDGVVRPMPCHGFARDMAWELIDTAQDEDAARAVCRLRSNAFTREMYPFDFELQMTCEIADGALRLIHQIESRTDGLIFSMGNHITIRLPFGETGSMADCLFATPATTQLTLSDASLLDGGTEAVSAADGVPVSDPRWHNTVLSGFPPGEYWAELRDPNAFTVRISHELEPADKIAPEWMLFVLYGNPEDSFHCPEPWVGGPDSLNTKRGVVTLAEGEQCTWTMTIEALGAE